MDGGESENGRDLGDCERDWSETKSEDIDSWRNLDSVMMKQQEMWKDVMAAVTVEKEIRERTSVRER